MALGAIMPLTSDFRINLVIFFGFLSLLVLSGAVYGIVYSSIVMFSNWKKFKGYFKQVFYEHKKLCYFIIVFGLVLFFVLYSFKLNYFIFLAFLIMLAPILFLFGKSLEFCMTKKIKVRELTAGDWLASPIKIGKSKEDLIKPYWEGVSEKELKIIRKKLNPNKLVEVKYGLEFTPAFLITWILLWVLIKYLV